MGVRVLADDKVNRTIQDHGDFQRNLFNRLEELDETLFQCPATKKTVYCFSIPVYTKAGVISRTCLHGFACLDASNYREEFGGNCMMNADDEDGMTIRMGEVFVTELDLEVTMPRSFYCESFAQPEWRRSKLRHYKYTCICGFRLRRESMGECSRTCV
ncbi:hypothetical protein AB6A40_008245 [Gnathostoma spinigerum]|uniref:Uncharacterized protein n=1 Tax=Gnathostoma spinigerum TaxID=75299 RepID=A0ABD6EVN7_9BILA